MKEQFVSYEIAKILQEKGFNELCFRYYRITPFSKNEQELCYAKSYGNQNEVSNIYLGVKKGIAAPLWQQVEEWLREKNIHLWIIPELDYNPIKYKSFITSNKIILEARIYKSYEEARLAAINWALNLI